MGTCALALESVSCRRGDRILFAQMTLVLAPGEAALVTGSNGAGKSSLLRIAAGLLAPYAGIVARTGAVSLADEATALDPELPLRRALAFWAAMDGTIAHLNAALDRMGIATLADVPVRYLSTGQRKRATLARVIASNAPIWLLDEPANGLDTAALSALADAMATHRADGGIVLAASHQPIGLADARAVTL